MKNCDFLMQRSKLRLSELDTNDGGHLTKIAERPRRLARSRGGGGGGEEGVLSQRQDCVISLVNTAVCVMIIYLQTFLLQIADLRKATIKCSRACWKKAAIFW